MAASTPTIGESTQFTAERLAQTANKEKQIIVTFTNRVRLDFAYTWVAHVRRLNLTNWLVGATDRRALRALVAARVPAFTMRTNLPEGEWDWGSPSFKALGQHKVELIYKALQWGMELVITDIDALVLREPFAYMRRYPDAGFLTTTDYLANTSSSDSGGLEGREAASGAFNIGYMFFRKSALPLVQAWRRTIATNPRGRWDQGEFNALARPQSGDPGRASAPLSDPRLFRTFGGRVVGGVLPVALFCGGHHYFVSQLPQRSHLRPYSIHTTFQYGGAPGKRHRLREAGVWVDDAAYFNVSVLRFTPAVTQALRYPVGGMSSAGHVALMTEQLHAIRVGLALAHSLGRLLVLPPIMCGYDKYWASLSSAGVIPGAHRWAVPISDCPLDHMLNPAELKPQPAAYVREHSFLANPRLHPSLHQWTSTALRVAGGEAEWHRLRDSMAVRPSARQSSIALAYALCTSSGTTAKSWSSHGTVTCVCFPPAQGARVLDITNLYSVASDVWSSKAVLPDAMWRRFRRRWAGL
jgi:arabinosyltransferase